MSFGEYIRGGDMYCMDCQQERETSFIPQTLVIQAESTVVAHTIRVCALCSSTDLKPLHSDFSRKNEDCFRW